MKKRECPSCAMQVPDDSTECPVCEYEFPRHKPVRRWVYISFVVILLLLAFLRIRGYW